MRKKSGYSREDRLRRITSVNPFTVIDNNRRSLLNRAFAFARFIKYYNSANIHDGYFDELFSELDLLMKSGSVPSRDGSMEPSQALLYTFLEQLYEVSQSFNNRWNNYAHWYLADILGVKPLPTIPDKFWLSFWGEGSQSVLLPKGTTFFLKEDDKVAYTYLLSENLEVQNIGLEKVYSLYWEKDRNILPAANLNFITSVRVKDLLNSDTRKGLMFGQNGEPQYAKALGVVISNPSLLLREGKRCVTMIFQSENDEWMMKLEKIIEKLELDMPDWSKEKILYELFNKVFYITISIQAGWAEIEEYTVKIQDNNLVLKFILAEDFPETTECMADVHHFSLPFPALRIYPNFDAWLYPYSWLKDFMLNKVIINTSVENASNVLLYNELGQIDNSKPFTPFGLNTERGAWFVIGNYEMSIRNINSVDIQIKWQQLPIDEDGLYSYYKSYEQKLDNRSFKLGARYLSDYDWHNTSNSELFYLFSSIKKDAEGSTLAQSRLSNETRLAGIQLDRMVPALLPENEYEYSIKSRTGYIRFVLEEPEIGMGEQYYRQLFTDRMIKKVFQKKDTGILNPPLNPVIEKITLDYDSQDIIDLRKHKAEGTEIFQLYPFGYTSVFSNNESQAMPFVYNLDTDANILFSFSNVKGGEVVTLFLEFYPVNKECTKQDIPQIVWYWGNGYYWNEASPNTILLDNTQNMIASGHLKIRIPDKIDKSLYDDNGMLWLRAGIKSNEENISELLSVHINVGQLVLDTDKRDENIGTGGKCTLVSEKKLPGIREFKQITSFYDGKDSENDIDMQIRVSEYITHRGKAVTARDFEYLILQAFSDVGKVKCLPGFDCKSDRKGVVSIVIIPMNESSGSGAYKPLASPYLMLRIEEFLAKYTSAYVQDIDVVNPVYEELLVRCDITFRENYSVALCKTKLNELFNHTIAPWQEKRVLPDFGYTIDMAAFYEDIMKCDFVENINQLSVIQITNRNEYYTLSEYGQNNITISPEQPHIIFVPAKEHIIESNISTGFGIDEMSVNETFIIGS